MLTDSPDTSTAFARLLTDSQAKLYAFVFAQVPDAHQAHDVFQETNRVLWEQAASFDHAREFLPWAFAVARNQIRAARQKARRDRLAFDDDTVARIADRMSTRAQALDDLRRQFPRRRQNQPAHRLRRRALGRLDHLRHQRQAEGKGLAGAGLGKAHHIAPLHRHRDGPGLDRGRIAQPHLGQPRLEVLGQAHIVEIAHIYPSRRADPRSRRMSFGAAHIAPPASGFRRKASRKGPVASLRRSGVCTHA